jgi:hypothetical protein
MIATFNADTEYCLDVAKKPWGGCGMKMTCPNDHDDFIHRSCDRFGFTT